MRVKQKNSALLTLYVFFSFAGNIINFIERKKRVKKKWKYECSYYSLLGRSNYRRSHCTALYTKYVHIVRYTHILQTLKIQDVLKLTFDYAKIQKYLL